ncbi:MAG: hypothetical protein IT534_12685 [Bauldia sp.]|nr:hypothetical protein [Bauldia sp.]
MTRLFCPNCGLALRDGGAPACDRCGVVFAAVDPARAGFDAANGLPLGEPPRLRCWHCGEAIGEDERTCPSCGIDLTRRGSASARFDVVDASPAPAGFPAAGAAPASPASGHYATSAPAAAETAPTGNYIRRHWRGQLPLGVSVWVNVFFYSFALNIILLFVQRPFVWSDSGLVLLVVGIVIWVVRVAVAVWQTVGVWRSAGASIRRRRREGRTFVWAVIARVWIVFLAVTWAIAFAVIGFVSIRDNVSIAFGDDPFIPPYTLAVVPDGTGVVLTGGIRFGVAGDVEAALDANPGIRTIYLTSEGGRMAPAGALFRLIRDRGLDTYALGPCYSACTIAFAGGASRTVGQVGELGFHAASFAGGQSTGLEQSVVVDYFQPYREAGFADAIISRARNTPSDDMWFPPDATLLGGNVLTAPRDVVARPPGIPVAMYLTGVASIISPYLPLDIAAGVAIENIAADGDRLTLVLTVERGARIPASVYEPAPATVCAMAGAATGATYVFVAEYSDGEPITRTEFDAASCTAIRLN